jgi:tRNA U34 5-methylaminomethyl-2-thiouridine-forming methyltransferase MnmC
VFIEAGLKSTTVRPLRILEVGLGTALNAQLTFETAKELGIEVHYTALEKFPITHEEADALSEAGMRGALPFLLAPQNERIHFGASSFNLIVEDLRTFRAEKGAFDLIYFDAFAPSAQPELWSDGVFENMYRVLATGGVLTTYCAKGVVKRSMKAAGFEVEALPGPPRKREMTRAWKR